MEEEFIIRSAKEEDLEEMYRLSNFVYFINLPSDREIIKEKIKTSIASFNGEIVDKFAREYIFVLENILDHSLVGTSMVIARHGNPASPHMYFQLKEVQKYSQSIHAGFIHKVMQLKFDTDGPTEIGGLVINPSYRGHKAKLGRQLSFSRFLFIKMKRRSFKNYIISELMPPLTESGESILWEAVGRKFTNLAYQEADLLSRKNKEFVTALFPKGEIYTCLLPGEARDAIGKVGEGAEPVKHMLERIGFRWREHIDPFDGGPHFWAETDKISIVKAAKRMSVEKEIAKRKSKEQVLCARIIDHEYYCIQTSFELGNRGIRLPKLAIEALRLNPGDDHVTVMPLEIS